MLAKLKNWTWRSELPGLALLLVSVGFTAYYAAPELRIGQIPVNDVLYHLPAAERLAESIAHGEPFLDVWVSEQSLGYPVWLSYPPLPHLTAAAVFLAFSRWLDTTTLFAILFYLLLAGLPISVYVGSRWLGLSPPAAGLASLLVYGVSSTGFLGNYGIGYGSVIWKGSGLYSQLFGLHVLLLSLGMSARALDSGKRSTRIAAAGLLALTALSHIVFGYAAFLTAGLLALSGETGARSRRLGRLITMVLPALILMAWFLVPLFLHTDVINHSRWEDAKKWDSFGAPFILTELFTGRFFDFERMPWMSLLLAAGAVYTAVRCRRQSTARRLLTLCGVWLVLFCGRETWGNLVLLAGVPGDLHMHRFQVLFELTAVLLGSYGIAAAWNDRRNQAEGAAVLVCVALALGSIGVDRRAYLKSSQDFGEQTLEKYKEDGPDVRAALADVQSLLAVAPGRVSGGQLSTWAKELTVGNAPVLAFLSRARMDQTTFLLHTMSKSGDLMLARDGSSPIQDDVYGIRAMVAPAGLDPGARRLVSVHGKFAVWESSPGGYFGLADIVGHYMGPPRTNYDISQTWLNSPLPARQMVLSLDSRFPLGLPIRRGEDLPPPSPDSPPLHGRIVRSTKVRERYEAKFEVDRPTYALVKITWNPDLVATVDGKVTPLIHVTPGFGAVALPAGEHEVSVEYQPGPLRAILFVVGLIGFGLVIIPGWPGMMRLENWSAARIAPLDAKLRSPVAVAALVALALGVVALHPLFRGNLVWGHDATAYPLRITEMARVLSEGQFPPVWTPDVAAGHGMPLLGFSPPLLYFAAMPLYVLGFSLTNCIQLTLVWLCFLGAYGIYRAAKLLGVPQFAALGAAIAWIFGPYLCLDLFVRAAFAEAAAFAMAPLALWAMLELLERPNAWRVAATALAVAAVQSSHAPAAVLMIPSLLLLIFVRTAAAPAEEKLRARRILAGLAAILFAYAVAAPFWLPSLFEFKYLHPERLAHGVEAWKDNFIQPLQLLQSRLTFGYPISAWGGEMAFDLGIVQLAIAGAGLFFCFRSPSRMRKVLGLSFGVIAIGGALMTTHLSASIWASFPPIQNFYFPWRALLLPGLFLPLLLAFGLERIGPKWTPLVLLLLIGLNLSRTEPKGYVKVEDEYYGRESIAKVGLNTTTYEEFEPRWAVERPPYYPKSLVGLSSPIEMKEIVRRGTDQQYLVKARDNALVESATYYYPGWHVLVDDKPVEVSIVPNRGTMDFQVPAGEHRVALEFEATPVRRAAFSLSLAGILLLVAAIVRERSQRGA